jgi:UDP-N-acetylmuramate dehydrogenase
MKLECDIELKKYTTIGIGGYAEHFYTPESREELMILVSNLEKPYFIGGGSNLLINDTRSFSHVINLREFDCNIKHSGGGLYYVGASVRLQQLIQYINKEGYGGIEYLYSVPGLVGGAIYMNAGRGEKYRQSISDYVVEVIVLYEGEIIKLPKSECEFSYRNSKFKNSNFIILGVYFSFQSIGMDISIKSREERIHYCKKAQDNSRPNIGTVFCEADRRIMRIVMKLNIGWSKGIQFSKKTTNWFLNNGQGKYKQAIRLIHMIKIFHIIFRKKLRIEISIWE